MTWIAGFLTFYQTPQNNMFCACLFFKAFPLFQFNYVWLFDKGMPVLVYSSYTPAPITPPLSISDPAVSYWYSSESVNQLLLSVSGAPFHTKETLCSGICSREERWRGVAHIHKCLHCEVACLSKNTVAFHRKGFVWGSLLWSLYQAGEGLEPLKLSDFVIPLLELDSYRFSGKNRRETLETGKILRQQMCNRKTTAPPFCGWRQRTRSNQEKWACDLK